MNYTKKLLKLINKNGGTVTSAQVTNANIPQTYLSLMKEKGTLIRIKRGFYMLPDTFEDEMYVLSCSYPKGVFSHGTALYIHGIYLGYSKFRFYYSRILRGVNFSTM